jgi:hypothetical protein
MRTVSILGTAAIVLLVSGCSGMGSRDFACPGYPGKPLCLPTSAIYRLTDGSGPPPSAMTIAQPGQGGARDEKPFFPEGQP